MKANAFALSNRMIACLALLGAASLSQADLVANFDDRVEGESFDVFTNGGIRFHDVITHEGGATNFTIDGSGDGSLGTALSPPNVLAFGAFVPGPGVAFGGIGAFQFTSDSMATTAGLDIWAFQGELGVNTVALRGYLGGQIVDLVSFSFENPATPEHHRLDLPVGTYDRFDVFSSGQAFQGDSCIVVDNVTVAAVPEPTSLALLGLSLFATRLRRRR